jgi:iron complex outermembrane receptor protein
LLSFNVTAYKIITSNYAQSVYPAPNSAGLNPSAQELGGEVTSNGVEVDLASKNYKGFTFFAGYSFNETKFTKSRINDVGSRLRYNPSNTGNLSVNYTFGNSVLNGLEFGFSALYFGKRYAGRSVSKTNASAKLIPLDPYFNFDLSAGYTIGKASVRGRITNLFNEFNYNAHDDNSINPIAPRQFALTFAYKL